MLDDDDRAREYIRRQAEADAQAFLEQGIDPETTGVPPPPQIKFEEVTIRPVELDMIGFGRQSSTASQGIPGFVPPLLPTGACCVGGVCGIETEADCLGMGGTYQGDDTPCSPDPC